MERVQEDFEKIIGDMTGESVPFWPYADVNMDEEQDFTGIVEPNMDLFGQQAWNTGNAWLGGEFVVGT